MGGHFAEGWGWLLRQVEAHSRQEQRQGFAPKLAPSRKGTPSNKILQLLVCARLIRPASELSVHREWYRQSGMGDLLGMNVVIVPKSALYHCHDKLLEQKRALFRHAEDVNGLEAELDDARATMNEPVSDQWGC